MKKIKVITSVSLIALMTSIPSAFADNQSSHQDCLHHMKEHCIKNHKKCMKKEKDHCEKMDEEEANRLNMLSILEHTPKINYEVRSIFLKGGKERIDSIDSDIRSDISSSANNIDVSALKIVPHNKDKYILSPLNLNTNDMNYNYLFNTMSPSSHSNDGFSLKLALQKSSLPLTPSVPPVLGHHQLFSSINSEEYDLGTPRVNIEGGSLSLKKAEDKINMSSYMTPQEFVEIEETIKHDPEVSGLENVSAIMNSGRSFSIDIPHYKNISAGRPIEALYSFEDKIVEKTGRYKKHDALKVKQVNINGGISMNNGAVNVITMPYSQELHGQDIILIKPTVSLGVTPNTIMPLSTHNDKSLHPHIDIH